MLHLAAGDYRLSLDPSCGGSIARFAWRDQPLMRPSCGPSVLDSGCFPLVPFSNRIAHGRFTAHGQPRQIAPNFPGSDHPHPLHGFGWLAAWDVIAAERDSAELEHCQPAGEWPWSYRARQRFRLDPDGLSLQLSLVNLGTDAMPAGLGFHPYFPCDPDTLYLGLHKGEWHNDADCLPQSLDEAATPQDWWQGHPVATRQVDTVYTGRNGPLRILWPNRRLRLDIIPCAELPFTVVYTPAGAAFFCVEPVSHMTDAINRPEPGSGLRWLAPGTSFTVAMRIQASALPPATGA